MSNSRKAGRGLRTAAAAAVPNAFATWALVAAISAWLQPTLVAAQQAAAAPAATRNGSGRPVCGLGVEFHSGRRHALCEKLGEGWILLRGLSAPREYTRFHQDKTFWYFTGIEAPDVALLMNAATGMQRLYAPAADPAREAWDGEVWDTGDDWIDELAGFESLADISSLDEDLRELLAPGDTIHIQEAPWVRQGGASDIAHFFDRHQVQDPFDGRPSREAALRNWLESTLQATVKDMSGAIAELRLVKQPVEVAAMRRAARAGALAMAEAIRSTRPGLGEWDIESLMAWQHVEHGAQGPAYHAIVGSGPNACVLHYSQSNRRMEEGDILLVDYGPEFDMYTTDITRTWPVNGTFSPRAGELYDIVREAQQAGIDAARPGGRIRDVYRAIDQVFQRHNVQHLVRHGPCHLIGLDVHDVGSLRGLVPGMTFTVEPGLYSEEEAIGIRIEDVVLITEEGCEILTRDVPVDRADIEALYAEPSILDRLHTDPNGR